MHFKTIAATSALVLVGIGLSGCATSAPVATSASVATNALSADREATITVWNPQDQWRKTSEFLENNVEAFKAKYPNVTVEFVDVPYGQYEARYVAGFTSGKNAPDIFMGQVSYYGGALGVAAEAPEDLQMLFEENLTPVTAGNFKIDGKWFGHPVSTDLGMQLFYNVEHFAAAGLDPANPPKTFEELREYANKLAVREGDKITRNGMALRYSGSPTGIADKALPYIHAFGGRMYAEDYSTAEGYLNGKETIAAVQYMQDLAQKDRVSSLELGSPDDTFAQGLSAMTFREGWYEGYLDANAPDVKYAVAPYPEGDAGYPKVSLLFNWAWMVNERSENKDIAWEWIRAMSNPETDMKLAKLEGYMPVWSENFNDPYVVGRNDYVAVEKQLNEGPGPAYNAPYTNQIAIEVGQAIEAAIRGADVEQTLTNAVVKVDELLKRGRE
jgi:multiple sugar transport system substrate-binding protein